MAMRLPAIQYRNGGKIGITGVKTVEAVLEDMVIEDHVQNITTLSDTDIPGSQHKYYL